MFGTSDVCSNVFGRVKTFFNTLGDEIFDNVNVNVVPYGNLKNIIELFKNKALLYFTCYQGNEHLYALTETSRICKLDPKNLEILKTINVTSYIPEATTTIAHPHVESDGSWLICGMSLSGRRSIIL